MRFFKLYKFLNTLLKKYFFNFTRKRDISLEAEKEVAKVIINIYIIPSLLLEGFIAIV